MCRLASTGPVTMRRSACAHRRASAPRPCSLSYLPHTGRVKAVRVDAASSPNTLHILFLPAAFLMLGAVASANIVKSPSLLNDAGHSAAYTHGFLLGRSLLFLSKISSVVSTKDAGRLAAAERLHSLRRVPAESYGPGERQKPAAEFVEHILQKVKEGGGRPTKRLRR